MSRKGGSENKGRPSATNKNEGLGEPAGKFTEDMKRDQELTDKYTDGNGNIADNVHQANPNRNVDKTDATNAGGYKN